MSAARLRRMAVCGPAPVAWTCTGCSRAPSFDILGSFFPAWLLCLVVGLAVTLAARWLVLRLHIVVAFPILTYPSLTALVTCALWLTFFR